MSAPESSDEALHEYVEVEIAVAELPNAAREQTLRSTLEELPGIQSVRVDGARVFLAYEPVRIVKSEIEAHLRRAGFIVEEVAVAAASPVVDATAPHPAAGHSETRPDEVPPPRA